MIKESNLVECIIRPALIPLKIYSKEAERLLVGTCAVESQMGTYLKQVNGPALGIYQIEPDTYKDIIKNYLVYRDDLFARLFPKWSDRIEDVKEHVEPLFYCTVEMLVYDLRFATAIARIHYLRVSEELPDSDDRYAQAKYWKAYYNTWRGKGTTEKYISAWENFVE